MGSMIWLVMMAVFLLPVIIRLISENRRGKPGGSEPKEKKTRIFDEVSEKMKSKVKKITIGLIIAAAAVVVFIMCIYAQDAGEVAVIRNLGGSLGGSTSEAGFHPKAPWQSIIKYDTRNNVVTFYGNNTGYKYNGGSAEGPEVTINDSSGATANIDIQVNYSLQPKYAEDLYRDYGTQESFVKAVVAIDSRSVPREVAGRFSTLQILTARSEISDAIQEALTEKWDKYGLIVEDVSVQDVRYSDSIISAYAEAQAAEIAKQKARNEQETAKVQAETKKVTAEVDAETKRIQAEAEANANRIVNESLTDNVIKQHYIEALQSIGEKGNLVVVPEGSQPIVGTVNGVASGQ